MPSKRHIIVGASRVFLGPSLDPVGNAAAITALKETSTTVTQATRMAGQTGWRDVGYTQDGLEVANDPSWGEVEVDQLLDAAKIFKDGMGFTVSTTFAEATLENLLVAWGQADSFLAGSAAGATINEIELDGGTLGSAPKERGLVAVGNGPEKADGTYAERTYFVYRVLSVDAASHSLARAEATTIPVSFRALPADNGKYGSIRDRLNVTVS
jgi:hypothetical protein